MQREFFICASFLRLNDASMFQKYSCQVSKPCHVSGGIFSKRVMDDDDRRKTFFLASCSEYSSLIYRVVTMEYRTSAAMHAFPVSPHALRKLSAAVVRPANSLIFHCASWASDFVPVHLVAIRGLPCRLESRRLKFTNEPSSIFVDGDLAESIKRSASDRLGDLVP